MESSYLIGVDVGSASVRAGLYSVRAKCFEKIAVQPISISRKSVDIKHHARGDSTSAQLISQSSQEIWDAVAGMVKTVSAGVEPSQIRGIGFDATCSLVVISPSGQTFDVDGVLETPTITSNGAPVFLDVIMWQDHRANEEADFVNEQLSDHDCLKYVGGQISLEMQLPKLLWLKRYRPSIFNSNCHFFDLCDFLTWKARGMVSHTPSMCSVVCKWLYQVSPTSSTQHGWMADIFQKAGLEELCADNFRRVGSVTEIPGTRNANGLSEAAANQMGLLPGLPVATGLIDAHSGGLGLSYCGGAKAKWTERLAMICGTSTCYMHCSKTPTFIPGVWGPYYSAMIPGAWLNEAGQSASGQFLDHIIQTHPFYVKSLQSCDLVSCYQYLNKRALESITKCGSSSCQDHIAFLTRDIHIFPDYHGNRSPLSNPDMKGMIMGLTLDGHSELSLIRLYLAALQALAYESRWIIETMMKSGSRVKDIAICGGLAGNPEFVQTLADVVGMPVLRPDITESVMLGSAILAAAAAGEFGTLEECAMAMAGAAKVVQPCVDTELYHKDRYTVFRKMADFQLNILKKA